MTARDFPIEDGKLDGNQFSSSISQETSHGVITTYYRGPLEGDTLNGTLQRHEASRVSLVLPFGLLSAPSSDSLYQFAPALPSFGTALTNQAATRNQLLYWAAGTRAFPRQPLG